jgi:hypothetical protein
MNTVRAVDTIGFKCIRELQNKLATKSGAELFDLVHIMENINQHGYNGMLFIVYDGGINTLYQSPTKTQISDTHLSWFEMYLTMHRDTRFFVLRNTSTFGEYIQTCELTKEEAETTVKSWDDNAVFERVPDNEGKFLHVDQGYEGETLARFKQAIKTAKDGGSFDDLSRCITFLAAKTKTPSNRRLRVHYVSPELDEIDFLVETIGKDGLWKRCYNGAMIFRREENTWTSHT